MSTKTIRADILEKAKACVCGEREADYGTPEDNFKRIAALWSAYKGTEFSAVDVAMMMALLKIGRIHTGGGTEDSFVDLAGYAACGGEISKKLAERVVARITPHDDTTSSCEVDPHVVAAYMEAS